MTQQHSAGAVAAANEEAVRAWDTVLYERWKTNRKVFVGALDRGHRGGLRSLSPTRAAGAASTSAAASAIRPSDLPSSWDPEVSRSAPIPHRGSSTTPVARRPRLGVENVDFEVADAQTAEWDQIYDYAFSRMGTQFFAAPVPAMRAIRGALKPGGKLRKICWRRKAESQIWTETEQVVQRFLSRPDEYEADTCGPGPFSLGNPETSRGILEGAGFEEIELHRRDFDYFMGRDMDEAVDAMLAIGPGAELIRLNGEHGESRRPEIAEALAGALRRLAATRRLDGRPRRPSGSSPRRIPASTRYPPSGRRDDLHFHGGNQSIGRRSIRERERERERR